MSNSKIQSRSISCASVIPDDVLTAIEPIRLPGLVREWPLVQAGLSCADDAVDYLLEFDRAIPLTVYHGPPEIEGRIFYNDDLSGFNFARASKTLEEVTAALLHQRDASDASVYYIGSSLIDHWLPGFRAHNDIDLGGREHLCSLWLGNRSRIAAHYDFPDNIACSVVGRRRFTLFPPDQVENLYIGPIDFTPSGQAISLVDVANPDFDRYPKYRSALAASITVELEPGDALFIPSMWWHSVESLEPLNVLVNYWWRTTPAYLGSPQHALQHAMMSLHNLPEAQLAIWRDVFERYVFAPKAQDWQHIPEHARGALSDIDNATAAAIRARLRRVLK